MYLSILDVSDADFTADALKNGLIAAGAPQDVIDKNFNVTPPVLFLKLDVKGNGSLVGFVFDANAEPTERPIVKGAAVGYSGMGAVTALALLLSLVVLF